MTNIAINQFVIATLLPPLATIVLQRIDARHGFSKRNYALWQLVVGLVFGLVAIYGTEFGIYTIDATMNVRDAAPLTAGIIFGGPAGIIAGIIGGVERWFAAYWGRGEFTQLACSLGTILSGFYAAFLRKTILEEHPPVPLLGIAVGFVDEVLHMLLIFFTNIDEAHLALVVVNACARPMVLCVGLSVGLSVVCYLLVTDSLKPHSRDEVPLTRYIQLPMLGVVLIAFMLTSLFTMLLQTSVATDMAEELLYNTIFDVQSDISDAIEERMRRSGSSLISSISDPNTVDNETLASLCAYQELEEVSVVDKNGRIIASSVPDAVGTVVSDREGFASMLTTLSNSWYLTNIALNSCQGLTGTQCRYAVMRFGDGYLFYGYEAHEFRHSLEADVRRSAKNRHIGETGYLVMSDEVNEQLVQLGDNALTDSSVVSSQSQLIESMRRLPKGQMRRLEFMGKDYFFMTGEVEGYLIVALYPEEEAMQARNTSMLFGNFSAVIILAILFLGMFHVTVKNVVDGIRRVNDDLFEITDGNLDLRVNERSSLEFTQLSDGINATVSSLKHHIEEEAARIDQELEYARAIQASALPTIFPPFPHHDEFEIYASMKPAKLVGGDFYDFYLLDDTHLAFLVADVSGKSIPGAMFMMRAKTVLRSFTEQSYPPCDVFYFTNNELCDGNASSMFVTSWMGVLDLATGHVCAANAGHNPPLIGHANGAYDYLELGHNVVLGYMEEVTYQLLEFDLAPGDAIFLYTDGVVEANSGRKALYGEDRLRALLCSLDADASTEEICNAVQEDVERYVGDAPQYDDITVLSVRYKGGNKLKGASGEVRGDMIEVETITKKVDVITDFVDERLEAIGCPLKARLQIDVAIDEVFANICEYAYSEGGPSLAWVYFEQLDGGKRVRITFEDEGLPFNPLEVPPPDITLSLDERGIGGYGIFIVRNTMDEVSYERRNNRNVLSFCKALC